MSDYGDKADDVADDFRMDELVTTLQGRIEALHLALANIKLLAEAVETHDWKTWALGRISKMAGAALDGEELVSDE